MVLFETHTYLGNDSWTVTLYDGSIWHVTGNNFDHAISTIPGYDQKVQLYRQTNTTGNVPGISPTGNYYTVSSASLPPTTLPPSNTPTTSTLTSTSKLLLFVGIGIGLMILLDEK